MEKIADRTGCRRKIADKTEWRRKIANKTKFEIPGLRLPTGVRVVSLPHSVKWVLRSTQPANNTGQQIFKKKCIWDEHVFNVFVCIYYGRKGTQTKLLGSSFKIMLPL
jgi:hypothetical protein